jgi:hypothetical protein
MVDWQRRCCSCMCCRGCCTVIVTRHTKERTACYSRVLAEAHPSARCVSTSHAALLSSRHYSPAARSCLQVAAYTQLASYSNAPSSFSSSIKSASLSSTPPPRPRPAPAPAAAAAAAGGPATGPAGAAACPQPAPAGKPTGAGIFMPPPAATALLPGPAAAPPLLPAAGLRCGGASPKPGPMLSPAPGLGLAVASLLTITDAGTMLVRALSLWASGRFTTVLLATMVVASLRPAPPPAALWVGPALMVLVWPAPAAAAAAEGGGPGGGGRMPGSTQQSQKTAGEGHAKLNHPSNHSTATSSSRSWCITVQQACTSSRQPCSTHNSMQALCKQRTGADNKVEKHRT